MDFIKNTAKKWAEQAKLSNENRLKKFKLPRFDEENPFEPVAVRPDYRQPLPLATPQTTVKPDYRNFTLSRFTENDVKPKEEKPKPGFSLDSFKKAYFEDRGWKFNPNRGAMADKDVEEYALKDYEAGEAYRNLYGTGAFVRSGIGKFLSEGLTPAGPGGGLIFPGIRAARIIKPEVEAKDIPASEWIVGAGQAALYLSPLGRMIPGETGVVGRIAESGLKGLGALAYTADTVMNWSKRTPLENTVSIGFDILTGLSAASSIKGTAEYVNQVNQVKDKIAEQIPEGLRKNVYQGLDEVYNGIKSKDANLLTSGQQKLAEVDNLMKTTIFGDKLLLTQGALPASPEQAQKFLTSLPESLQAISDLPNHPQSSGIMANLAKTLGQLATNERGSLGRPAEVLRKLSTPEQTAQYKALQTEAAKAGLDLEAVQGIAEGESWTALSLKRGKEKDIEKVWSWANKFPEATSKFIMDKFIHPPVGMKPQEMFIPFKSIQDAAQFLKTGDTSLIAKEISLKGEPMSPENIKKAQAELARTTPDTELSRQIAELETKLEAKHKEWSDLPYGPPRDTPYGDEYIKLEKELKAKRGQVSAEEAKISEQITELKKQGFENWKKRTPTVTPKKKPVAPKVVSKKVTPKVPPTIETPAINVAPETTTIAQPVEPPKIKPTAPTEVIEPETPVVPPVEPSVPQPPVPPVQPPTQPPVAVQPPAQPVQPAKSPMSRIIKQSQEVVKQDRPGLITKLTQKIPLLKQIREWEKPGLKMTGENEKILVASVAENAAKNDVLTHEVGTGRQVYQSLKSAFGKKSLNGDKTNVQFIGNKEQSSPIDGTLLDIIQRTYLYNLTKAQRQALDLLDVHNDTSLKYVTEGYGAEIGSFQTKGGHFISNVDISEDIIEALGSETRAVATGRGKTRFYQSAAERLSHDPTFKPELNIVKLINGMDRFKASAASGQTMRTVLEGKTKLEVIQETHPNLYNKMMGLRKRLQKLQGYKGVLAQQQQEAIDTFLSSGFEDTDLVGLVAGLETELKPGRYVAKSQAGKAMPDIQKEIDGVRAQIKALKPAWNTANLKPYVFVQDGIYKYFPGEQANLIKELRKKSNNPLLNFVENIRGMAFSGDLSPILGVQTPLGILFDPIGSVNTAFNSMGEMVARKNIAYPFSVADLSNDITKNPNEWAEYFSLIGRAPTGTPAEFAGGFLSKIPKFSQFNEGTYVMVTRQSKALFDRVTKQLIKSGLDPQVAKVAAADQVDKVFPLLNPSRMGQSESRAAILRALPTSYSFIRKPAEMMLDASRGLFKLGTGQKISPREKMSIQLMITLSATILAVSAASNVLSNPDDPEKAIKESINPDYENNKFANLIIGKWKIPLGGPFRSWFRAIYPRKVEGIPFPVPFMGIPNFLMNRLTPFFKTQLDLLRNKDYYGRAIVKGAFPENLIRLISYEIEGALPLAAGSLVEGIRTDADISDIVEEVGSQFAGITLSKVKETAPPKSSIKKLPSLSKGRLPSLSNTKRLPPLKSPTGARRLPPLKAPGRFPALTR